MCEVIYAILDVICDIADLLDLVLGLLIVGSSGRSCLAKLAEEGVHAGEFIVHVLDLAADTADESVLLGQEAAKLAQK